MFVCVSPSDSDAPETLCSLNFAARVRNVELGPAKKNQEHKTPAKASAAEAKKALEESERKELRIRELENELQQQTAAGTFIGRERFTFHAHHIDFR